MIIAEEKRPAALLDTPSTISVLSFSVIAFHLWLVALATVHLGADILDRSALLMAGHAALGFLKSAKAIGFAAACSFRSVTVLNAAEAVKVAQRSARSGE